MKNKIGFIVENNSDKLQNNSLDITEKESIYIRPCLCEVYFDHIDRGLTYFCDSFDVKPYDHCFVSGKLAGYLGTIINVCYSFKIKPSDYEKIISIADTPVTGVFHQAQNMFITFDKNTLPYSKAITWFAPPENDEKYVTDTDDLVYQLDDLSSLDIDCAVAQRAHEYFIRNKIAYIELDKTHAKAIVTGSKNYVIEFDCKDGEISNMTCNCMYTGTCKHEVATLLQLKSLLNCINKYYADKFDSSDYFSAILKTTFFSMVINTREDSTFEVK